MISGEKTDTNKQSALAAVNNYAREEATRRELDANDANVIRDLKRQDGLRTEFAGGENARHRGRIITNYLSMRPPAKIFVYTVEMIRGHTTATPAQPILVSKRADSMEIIALITQYIPQLQVQGNGTVEWVTDGDLIWSTADLFGVQALQPQPLVHLAHNPPNVRLTYDNECGQTLSLHSVNIYFHRLIAIQEQPMSQLTHDHAAQNVRTSTPEILIRGLNAFLTNHARQPGHIWTFTSAKKGYEPRLTAAQENTEHRYPRLERNSANQDLLLAREGFFVSSRPGVESLLVNINPICSPFIGAQSVQQFLSTGWVHDMSPQQKNALLKGTMVRITFDIPGSWPSPKSGRRFVRSVGTRNQMFCHQNPTGQGVDVHTCFATNIGTHRHIRPARNLAPNPNSYAVEVAVSTLTGPTAPASEWYPAEFLQIVEHQPFHGQLSNDQITAMVYFARQEPQKSYRKIIGEGLRGFGLDVQGQNGLSNFGNMSTGQQMLDIPAHWLAAPTVRYGSANPASFTLRNTTDAEWNMAGNVLFAQHTNKVQALHVVNVNGVNAGGHLNSNSPHFRGKLEVIAGALHRHGILATATPTWRFNNAASDFDLSQTPAGRQYELAFGRKLTANRPVNPRLSPVLVTINGKNTPVYSCIKRAAELACGINTVIINLNGSRFEGPKGSNIALKYNLKLRQANHILGPNDFRALGGTRQSCETIVIGADVTHPGKGAAYGTPSIAAVVGSTDDNFTHFPGSMRLQRSKKEYIIELGDMVKERLIDWAENHKGRLPSRMLFYRDGVSESQYAKLQSYEIPQIRQAFNWAQEFLNFRATGGRHDGVLDQRRDPWPNVSNPSAPLQDRPAGVDDLFSDDTGLFTPFKLTFVVVGKRHNTRFYPVNEHNRSESTQKGNAKPGLLVDQVITHPLQFDFYLQSHKPMSGTARSAHYIVLQNNMTLSASQLQEVTHNFCYIYARATKGVSYCAPAYYADRLCDRGRCYIYHLLGNSMPNNQPITAINPRGLFIRPKDPATETALQHLDWAKDFVRDTGYYRLVTTRNPPERKYGFVRRNPWHTNLDNTMFYL